MRFDLSGALGASCSAWGACFGREGWVLFSWPALQSCVGMGSYTLVQPESPLLCTDQHKKRNLDIQTPKPSTALFPSLAFSLRWSRLHCVPSVNSPLYLTWLYDAFQVWKQNRIGNKIRSYLGIFDYKIKSSGLRAYFGVQKEEHNIANSFNFISSSTDPSSFV